MTMRARFVVALVVVGLVLTGCSGIGGLAAASEKGNAALVNGEPVTLAAFNEQVKLVQDSMVEQGLDPKSDEGKRTLEQMRSDLLQQMIDVELMRQAAADEGIVISSADVEARLAQIMKDAGGADAFKKSLKESGLTEAQFRSLILRDQMIYEQLYEKLTARLPATAEQVRVRHILVNSEQDATAVMARLAKGEDFAVVAKEVSLDGGTKENGGDLGFFPRGVFDPSFEYAAFSLKLNEVSKVKTDYGYHVIVVTERDAARTIAPEYVQFLGDEAVNTYMEGLRGKAKIEILIKLAPTATVSP